MKNVQFFLYYAGKIGGTVGYGFSLFLNLGHFPDCARDAGASNPQTLSASERTSGENALLAGSFTHKHG